MTAQRTMTYALRHLAGEGLSGRWRWTVYADPDRTLLRGGQVSGDRAKAERAARAAVTLMGGVVQGTGGEAP